MHALTKWILGPVWHSVLLAAVCHVVPYTELLAIVIQLLVTLRQGMVKGLVVTLGSSLLGVSLGFLVTSAITDVSYSLFIDSLQWALTISLPLWLFAGLLRSSVSQALTLQVMTLVFMAFFVISTLGDMSIMPASLKQAVTAAVDSLTANLMRAQQSALADEGLILSPENVEQVSQFLIRLFETVSVFTLYLLTLILARAWQSAVFQPGGFRQEFIHLRAGTLPTVVVASAWLLLFLLTGEKLMYSLSGLVFIGSIWLFVNGLAFTHWLINQYKLSWGSVMFIYFALMLPGVSVALVLVLAIVGFFDGCVNFRKLIKKSSQVIGE